MVDQTPALKAVIDELEKRLGSRYSGYRTPQVIRPIISGGKRRPDLGYSQHSYRNASDIFAWKDKQKPITDELARMKQQGYPVGTVLDHNYNADHHDHVHVEGSPKVTGDPKKPSTWNISGGSGDVPANLPTGTKPAGDETELEDLNWWDYVLNPGKVADTVKETLFNEVILRVVFGILAIIGVVVTVIVMVAAFKGDEIKQIAGAAIGSKVPG